MLVRNKPVGMLQNLRGAIGASLLHAGTLIVACALMMTVAFAGETSRKPGQATGSRKTHPKARPKTPTPVLPLESTPTFSQPPVSPPVPQTPEQMPPGVPQVLWDGRELTINSDNSTLSDILAAIRTSTGAELEVPANASHERVAARLGPGPAREVIGTLLSWTEFDYVIQASDANPLGIRSVVLFPRPKSDVMASAMRPEGAARFAYRRLAPPAHSSQETAVAENPPQSESDALTEPPPESQQPQPTAPQPDPPQPTSAIAGTAAPDTAPGEPQPQPIEPQPVLPDSKPLPTTPEPDPNDPAASPSEKRMQQMQNLYEQRKQMMIDARKPSGN